MRLGYRRGKLEWVCLRQPRYPVHPSLKSSVTEDERATAKQQWHVRLNIGTKPTTSQRPSYHHRHHLTSFQPRDLTRPHQQRPNHGRKRRIYRFQNTPRRSESRTEHPQTEASREMSCHKHMSFHELPHSRVNPRSFGQKMLNGPVSSPSTRPETTLTQSHL